VSPFLFFLSLNSTSFFPFPASPPSLPYFLFPFLPWATTCYFSPSLNFAIPPFSSLLAWELLPCRESLVFDTSKLNLITNIRFIHAAYIQKHGFTCHFRTLSK
jgi:hypothetical protein